MKRTGCYERKLQRDHLDWRSWKASRSTIYQEKSRVEVHFKKYTYLLIRSISTYKRTDKGQNFFFIVPSS